MMPKPKSTKALCKALRFAVRNLEDFARPAVRGRVTSVPSAIRKAKAALRRSCR